MLPSVFRSLPRALPRLLTLLLALLAGTRVTVGLAAWRAAERLEKPTYTLLRRLPNRVELRLYDPFLVAETAVPRPSAAESAKSPTSSTGMGFRSVAKYIFGGNRQKVKMAMTAPVITSSRGDETKVAFVMSSQYSKRTAPRPMDRSVQLRRVEGRLVAARKFSGGPPSEARVERERQLIESTLDEAGIRPQRGGEEVLVSGYHDPFLTPNLLRKNEVALLVDANTVEV